MASSKRQLLVDYFNGFTNETKNYVKNQSALRNTIGISVSGSGSTISRNTSTPLTAVSDAYAYMNTVNAYVEFALNSFDKALVGQNCELRYTYRAFINSADIVTAQVVQGSSIVASQALINSPTDTVFSNSLNFPCGDNSQTTVVRFTKTSGSNATDLYLANVYVGKATNVGSVAQAQFVGTLSYATTANCSWSTTSGSYANFAADTDCPTPTTTGNLEYAGSKIPGFKISNAAPGNYYIIANGLMYTNGTGTDCTYRLNDGTNSAGFVKAFFDRDDRENYLLGNIKLSAATTDWTVQIQGYRIGGASACSINNNNDVEALTFSVYHFPTQSEVAYRPEQVNFLVDANISGANFDLGTSAVTSYSEMTNASMTLTNNTSKGSSTSTQIACASGTASSGTTCSAANESNGIAFNIPTAGIYEACVEFAHYSERTAGSTFDTTFQIVETSNTSSTVIQEGGSRVDGGGTGATSAIGITNARNLCGTFNFSSVGQKTLRLVYEQSANGGSTVYADGNTSFGQRDIHWTVRSIQPNIPAPLLVGSVTSNSTGAERMERIMFGGSTVGTFTSTCTSTPCTIWSQSGSWVSSVTRNSVGNYTLNIASGIFSDIPTCTITAAPNSGTLKTVAIITATSTSLQVVYRDSADANSIDAVGVVLCMGPKA